MIPCNLQRGNTFCKHLNKGERRGRVRSASVSWRYWGPGTHPESCLQSPRCRGQSTRPKSPGSTRSQWSCRTEVREEWWTAAATVVKLGHPGAAAHCWHCPECPCFCHLKILVHHINKRGYLTTKVNYLLWTFKGFLKWWSYFLGNLLERVQNFCRDWKCDGQRMHTQCTRLYLNFPVLCLIVHGLGETVASDNRGQRSPLQSQPSVLLTLSGTGK